MQGFNDLEYRKRRAFISELAFSFKQWVGSREIVFSVQCWNKKHKVYLKSQVNVTLDVFRCFKWKERCVINVCVWLQGWPVTICWIRSRRSCYMVGFINQTKYLNMFKYDICVSISLKPHRLEWKDNLACFVVKFQHQQHFYLSIPIHHSNTIKVDCW